MSSTNVHSNQDMASVAGSIFQATPKTLEVPPKGQVFEAISSYIESQGNLEIAVGNATLKENGEMIKQDGTTQMMGAKSFDTAKKYKTEREQRAGKHTRSIKTGTER